MLSSLLHSLNAVAVILFLTGVGYFCSALGWMTPDAKSFLTKYLMRFAVPVMSVYSMRTNLSMDLLRGSWSMLLIPTITQILLYTGAGFLGKQLRLAPQRNSVFKLMCAVSNAMFIGYSMCLELFGESCVPYVMLYFLINTAFSQMIGISGIRRSSGQPAKSVGAEIAAFLRMPTVIGVLVGILLILVDWTPPAVLMSCARYINNTVTPLALLAVGNVIHSIGLKNLKLNLLTWIVMGFRFLLAPGICLLLCAVFRVTGLARSVLTVMTAMPVLAQTVVASSEYGGDEELAAQGVAISTLACFIVIPVLMLLL